MKHRLRSDTCNLSMIDGGRPVCPRQTNKRGPSSDSCSAAHLELKRVFALIRRFGPDESPRNCNLSDLGGLDRHPQLASVIALHFVHPHAFRSAQPVIRGLQLRVIMVITVLFHQVPFFLRHVLCEPQWRYKCTYTSFALCPGKKFISTLVPSG